MKQEPIKKRSELILAELRTKYPNVKTYDLDGRDLHFVCEVEPVTDHQEYDRAIEVILSSKPHKHLKMTQHYTVLSGKLNLYVDNGLIKLQAGDKYTINSRSIHWASSAGNEECWVEIYSQPEWTPEDHIPIETK